MPGAAIMVLDFDVNDVCGGVDLAAVRYERRQPHPLTSANVAAARRATRYHAQEAIAAAAQDFETYKRIVIALEIAQKHTQGMNERQFLRAMDAVFEVIENHNFAADHAAAFNTTGATFNRGGRPPSDPERDASIAREAIRRGEDPLGALMARDPFLNVRKAASARYAKARRVDPTLPDLRTRSDLRKQPARTAPDPEHFSRARGPRRNDTT